MNCFAENLRTVRKNKGWTQSQAAEQISKVYLFEITENIYQNWELGRGEPDIDGLLRIAEIFLIDDLYLFLLKPIKYSNDA